WDSGRVAGSQTTQVVYRGKPLASGERCVWKVRGWDRDERPTGYSAPASWEMGLLRPEEWKAGWIGLPASQDPGPCPYLRKQFTLRKPLRRARIYATALGVYELYLNGQRVGRDILDPGWTD